MLHRIYLDNSATTPIAPEVVDAMLPYLKDKFGNASSIHFFGQEARAAVDKARHQAAALINSLASCVGTAVRYSGVPRGRISASAAISAAPGRVVSSEKRRAKAETSDAGAATDMDPTPILAGAR